MDSAYRQTEDPSALVALAGEAARRALGFTLFPTQFQCAAGLVAGRIVEMKTGEGKTLAAVPAAAALAHAGNGVHVLTANDYLARRDAEWMRPAYELLGLRVASISQSSTSDERRDAYNADVTYIAATEAGFDHLRDCRARTRNERVQRQLHAVIVDEADSILIDEARIPLVLAAESGDAAGRAKAAAEATRGFQRGIHFEIADGAQDVQITQFGLDEAERRLNRGDLYSVQNNALLTALYHAIHAAQLLSRDIDYLVREGRVVPVDVYKGRMAYERRWPAGIHSALEWKEGLPVRDPGRIVAQITLQNYVLQYGHVCGMTGTAATQADEFQRMYGLDVEVIPTHKPIIRRDLADRLYATATARHKAVIEEIHTVHAEGRPVLIGTASVEASEILSASLGALPHKVLNAKHEAAEAELIAQAGRQGAITVSTNMAGRGVDIVLGAGVAALGGLHVIGTCRHDARRIDNQLRGRAGRQGDPGSSRFFLSLDDEIVTRFRDGEERISTVEDVNMLQRRSEGVHLDARLLLHKYERIIEGQRHALLEKREEYLERCESEPENPEWHIRLEAIDETWACYLEEIADLKTGFPWLNLGGREPLAEYIRRVDQLFGQLWEQVEIETQARLESGDTSPEKRGATWTYLTIDQPFGTGTERIIRGLIRKAKSGRLLG